MPNNWDSPEPSWKDEPDSDYRLHPAGRFVGSTVAGGNPKHWESSEEDSAEEPAAEEPSEEPASEAPTDDLLESYYRTVYNVKPSRRSAFDAGHLNPGHTQTPPPTDPE